MATPTRQLEGPLPALAGGAVPELSAHAEPGGDGEQQRGVEAQRHAHAARVRQRARRRRPRQHPHVAARALRRQRLCSTNTVLKYYGSREGRSYYGLGAGRPLRETLKREVWY